MPTIPKSPRTVSQLIESQLPDFVRESDPMLIAFLKAYYEWLELSGAKVYDDKVVSTTVSSVTLTNIASDKKNNYQNMHIICMNGPSKGHTRKIKGYDEITKTVFIEPNWELSNIPPPNTKMVIRDTFFPGKLLEYKDIDYTLDFFIDFFRNEFMYKIPGNILADERNILKHIKEFYQAKGTENSFRFIFRILFGEEVEFYYPKVDLFRLSAAHWFTENIMKISTTGNTFDFVNRLITGVYSGATAKVESVTQKVFSSGIITELKLSNIEGFFQIDPRTGKPEQIKINYTINPPAQTILGASSDLLEPFENIKWEQSFQILEGLTIQSPGQNYLIGETITISGGGEIKIGTGVITSVFQTYFTGRCSPPPTTFYLEPFYGPNDTVNTTGDFTQDAVCIPGMYYYSDVHSDYTAADLLNANEIKLAQSETNIDDFFVDDEITLVGGTGNGESSIIVSYNGTTKVATVNTPFSIIPDATTLYSITHSKGGIKSVKLVDFGLGFLTTPTVTINTVSGTNGIINPILGIVGKTEGQWALGKPGGIGEVLTLPDSFASSNKIIQDSYYWQDFSYDLRFGETIDKYRDVVKSLLHPAGFKMFGSVLLKSKPDTGFLKLLENIIIELENNFFETKISAFETTVLQINTIDHDELVIGATNQDFDRFKFRVFPPNDEWNIIYPYPNQNYWSKDGPANTQIQNFSNRTISSFIDFPKQRTKINSDATVYIESTDDVSKVGPIGQNLSTITKFRFTGFPPFEGFDETYPPPNDQYWIPQIANTQLKDFGNIILSDLFDHPQNIHSNFTVDSDIRISNIDNGIPLIGKKVEYNFIEGINSQIVYNVSSNSSGQYDAALGSTILSESNDGTWVSKGVQLDSSNSEIVNATGVPLNLSECTVIVIAMCPSVGDMSIINSIGASSDNGFSLDVRANGAISFRVQNNNVSKSVTFPELSVRNGTYFMAALRFDHGKLSGNVSNSRALSTNFPLYPVDPNINTTGWIFGKSTVDYVPVPQTASLFSNTQFGKNKFSQEEITDSPISISFFNGTLAYAIFYDRAIYDFELDSIYTSLQEKLLDERGIVLHDTNKKTQLGISRIRINNNIKNLSGISHIVKQQNITGLSRIRVHKTFNLTGIANIFGTTSRNQSGVSSVKLTTARTQSGISRFRVNRTTNVIGLSRITGKTTKTQSGISSLCFEVVQTQSGISRIQPKVLRLQVGISSVRNTTVKTQSGVSKLQNTILKTESGISRITAKASQTQSGVSRIRITTTVTTHGVSQISFETIRSISGISKITAKTTNTQLGISKISAKATQTQTGISRLQVTALKTQIGVSRFNITSLKTQTGISRLQVTATLKTQIGISRITNTVQQTQAGISRIAQTVLENLIGVSRIQLTTDQTQDGVSNIV